MLEALKQKSVIAVLSLFVLSFIVLVLADLTAGGLSRWAGNPSRSGYYAVFLTNGQAYFGTIGKEDDKRMVLNNIYYIQKSPDSQAQSDITLLKLGNEVHGPEDMMEINKSQLLFVEKLKSDGRVMKAIQDYKK
ncbi:MAG: hypothetical protein WC551_00030 [Patescibacteria group bacterium]